MIERIETPKRLREIGRCLRQHQAPSLDSRIRLLHAWGERLRDPALGDIGGLPFLYLWLRRGTLEPLAALELGRETLSERWLVTGAQRRRAFPLGVVGHWPAANIPVQPILSFSVAFLAGNASLVRVPSSLVDTMHRLIAGLHADERFAPLIAALHCVSFPHGRRDLQVAMAEQVDGAMLWGGQEAIESLRSLPFPYWSRVHAFGPRISLALMDGEATASETALADWCRRLTRDVWQFDQQACSSPQFLLVDDNVPFQALRQALITAFRREERAHPRRVADPAQTAAIVRVRQQWLMAGEGRTADFPATPAWTLLWGAGAILPEATQGRVLTVLRCPDLLDAVRRLDAGVQTIGLAIGNPDLEAAITELAAARGVDRIVRLGHMHTFGSPWDGHLMLNSLVRWVEHLPTASQQPRRET